MTGRRRAAGRARSCNVIGMLLIGALALATASCATTYDETQATTAPSSTTTTLPSGTPAELLQRMLGQAAQLGNLIDEDDSEATPALEQLEATWVQVRPSVEQAAPQLLEDFDANLGRARKAVEGNRPADADKAYRNLATLVASYPAAMAPTTATSG